MDNQDTQDGNVSKKWLMAILVVAACVRFLACMVMPPDKKPWSDSAQYVNLGTSLADGHGYRLTEGNCWPGKPTIIRTPGWPLLLSIPFQVAPESKRWSVARALTVSLDLLNVCLLVLLARGIGLSSWASLSAGGLYAINPVTIYYCPLVGVEVPGITTVLLFLLVGVFGQCRTLFWCVATGVVAGVATLVRSNYLLIPVIWGAGMLWQGRRRFWPVLGKTLIVGGVALLILSPWLVRNAVVFGAFPVFGAGGGETFFGGNNDLAADPHNNLWGYIVQPGGIPNAVPLSVLASRMNEVEVDRYWMCQGWEWLKTHPGKIPVLVAGKLRRAFIPIPYSRSPGVWLVSAYRMCVMAAAIAALIYAFRRRLINMTGIGWWFGSVALAHLLTAIIFCGVMRYIVAFEMLLVIPAGWAMARLFCRRQT